MLSFSHLSKNNNKKIVQYPVVKIALLGDSALQFMAIAIKGWGIEKKTNIDLYQAAYSQIDSEIFDHNSGLYQFKPQFIFICCSVQKLKKSVYQSRSKGQFHKSYIKKTEQQIQILTSVLDAKIIHSNFPMMSDEVFGNYAMKRSSSFSYQSLKINAALADLAISEPSFFICNIAAVATQMGEIFFDHVNETLSDMDFSLDAIPYIGKQFIDIVASLSGRFKKCVIVDLDNTLWGGIIGDDGLEKIQIGDLGVGKAFTEFQIWLKQLKERGIILAVCSKNTESVAKEPFLKHPEMVLRMEDIAVFVANWENKADNIRYIQKVLNIGFDSMVFLDDNPFERNLVGEQLPDIEVPELPQGPSMYLSFLQKQNLFEIGSLSSQDKNRTRQYQTEAKRVKASESFTDLDGYLASLEMMSCVQSFDDFNIPRIAQLSQRSNQFNLRTIRYSDKQIQTIRKSDRYITFAFSLSDKYGDHGLVCAIILEIKEGLSLFIDTWIMSCRVLKRGMEEFVMNQLMDFAKENGYRSIIGEYIPSSKNELVKNHFKNLGFVNQKDLWNFTVSNYYNFKSLITNQ